MARSRSRSRSRPINAREKDLDKWGVLYRPVSRDRSRDRRFSPDWSSVCSSPRISSRSRLRRSPSVRRRQRSISASREDLSANNFNRQMEPLFEEDPGYDYRRQDMEDSLPESRTGDNRPKVQFKNVQNAELGETIVSRPMCKDLWNWILIPLSLGESKRLADSFQVKFDSAFSLRCPLLDKSILRRMKFCPNPL